MSTVIPPDGCKYFWVVIFAGGREKLFEKSFSLPPALPSHFKNF